VEGVSGGGRNKGAGRGMVKEGKYMSTNEINKNEYNDEKEIKKGRRRTGGDVVRLVINRDADAAICELLVQVNDGFVGGRAGKSDLVNWIMIHAKPQLTEAKVQQIREVFFDELLKTE